MNGKLVNFLTIILGCITAGCIVIWFVGILGANEHEAVSMPRGSSSPTNRTELLCDVPKKHRTFRVSGRRPIECEDPNRPPNLDAFSLCSRFLLGDVCLTQRRLGPTAHRLDFHRKGSVSSAGC
jgi:hypothetical protein